MPFIDWASLPKAVREHLSDRARTREITQEDFGRFKLAGEGPMPTTFLMRDQACVGVQI